MYFELFGRYLITRRLSIFGAITYLSYAGNTCIRYTRIIIFSSNPRTATLFSIRIQPTHMTVIALKDTALPFQQYLSLPSTGRRDVLSLRSHIGLLLLRGITRAPEPSRTLTCKGRRTETARYSWRIASTSIIGPSLEYHELSLIHLPLRSKLRRHLCSAHRTSRGIT